MTELSMISLERRRWNQTSKFAVKLSEDPDFRFLFPLKKFTATRNRAKYQEYRAYTKRFQVSPVVSYVKLLNDL